VPPDHVGLPITIDIRDVHDLPSERHTLGDDRPASDDNAVHEPHRHVTRLGVAPDQIRLVIPIEVSGPYDAPRQRNAEGDELRAPGLATVH